MSTRPKTSVPYSPLDGLTSCDLTARRTLPHKQPIERGTTLRTRLGSADKRAVELLCIRISDALATTVRPSNLLRALLALAVRHESQCRDEARHTRGLIRPANEDHAAMRDFDNQVSELLLRALAPRPEYL